MLVSASEQLLRSKTAKMTIRGSYGRDDAAENIFDLKMTAVVLPEILGDHSVLPISAFWFKVNRLGATG